MDKNNKDNNDENLSFTQYLRKNGFIQGNLDKTSKINQKDTKPENKIIKEAKETNTSKNYTEETTIDEISTLKETKNQKSNNYLLFAAIIIVIILILLYIIL